MAAQKSAQSQNGSPPRAMPFNRNAGVFGTRGNKTALGREQRGYAPLIQGDQTDSRYAHGRSSEVRHGRMLPGDLPQHGDYIVFHLLIAQPFGRNLLLGYHYEIDIPGNRLTVFAKTFPDQSLDAISPHSLAHFLAYCCPQSRAQAVILSGQGKKDEVFCEVALPAVVAGQILWTPGELLA